MFVTKINNIEVNFITYTILTEYVLFSLQGNPYCNYDSKLETDAERCYCKQICMIIPGTYVHVLEHFTIYK